MLREPLTLVYVVYYYYRSTVLTLCACTYQQVVSVLIKAFTVCLVVCYVSLAYSGCRPMPPSGSSTPKIASGCL